MSDEREYVMAFTMQADGRIALEFNTLGKSAVREEVVRCRDCKRFSLDNSDHDYRSGWWCHRWNTDMVKPDGFCAWGKGRDA